MNFYSAETYLTVRTVESCGSTLQEFARIIFVDDVLNHPKKIEDHAPLAKRPSFDSFKLAPSKVVCFVFAHKSVFIRKLIGTFFWIVDIKLSPGEL